MTAKPPAQRVQELRERRAILGLTRLELYAHPEDHEAIKEKAARLQRARFARALKREKQKEQGK